MSQVLPQKNTPAKTGTSDQRIAELEEAITVTMDGTLTDAERCALRDAADRYAEISPESSDTAATLRGLLERF